MKSMFWSGLFLATLSVSSFLIIPRDPSAAQAHSTIEAPRR